MFESRNPNAGSERPYIDVDLNRRSAKYSKVELIGRVIWSLVWPLFRFSPRLAWGWRNLLLRLMGAKVGRNVRVFHTVEIIIPWTLTIKDDVTVGNRVILYALGPMTLCEGVTISQGAHLCGGTHDFRNTAFPLIKAPIFLGEGVWVGADAFVGPGVRVGSGAVLGARAVVVASVPKEAIMVGNPARQSGSRSTRQ
jgi:putative colanic acid biosynthesis acetyltransferase WcaF